MPNYRRMARRSAQRYGLNPDIFERQINQESGYADDVIHGRRVSSAGAQGIAQIMPATARGWGVNPLNPKAALNAAAKNMARYVKAYGGYENALRAYNAGPGNISASRGFSETNKYVANILRGNDPGRLSRPTRTSGGGGPRGTSGGGGTSRFDLQLVSPANAAAALSAVTAQRPRPPTTPPSAPSFSAGVSLPQGYQGLEPAQAEQARTDYATALQKINEAGAQTQSIADLIKRTDIPGTRRGGGGAGGGGGAPAAGGRGVNLTPRGGYKGTEGPVRSLAQIGKSLGLQVTSAKRDNTNPYSGSRSDHDYGNTDATARDMSNGSMPTPQMDAYAKRIATALGIPYKKGTPINKTTTVNGVRYQLIYRGSGSAFGGNHMNHVHLGAKRVGRGPARGVLR